MVSLQFYFTINLERHIILAIKKQRVYEIFGVLQMPKLSQINMKEIL